MVVFHIDGEKWVIFHRYVSVYWYLLGYLWKIWTDLELIGAGPGWPDRWHGTDFSPGPRWPMASARQQLQEDEFHVRHLHEIYWNLSFYDSMDWFSRENWNRKAPYLMGKSMVSCRLSLKPIHWMMFYVNLRDLNKVQRTAWAGTGMYRCDTCFVVSPFLHFRCKQK